MIQLLNDLIEKNATGHSRPVKLNSSSFKIPVLVWFTQKCAKKFCFYVVCKRLNICLAAFYFIKNNSFSESILNYTASENWRFDLNHKDFIQIKNNGKFPAHSNERFDLSLILLKSKKNTYFRIKIGEIWENSVFKTILSEKLIKNDHEIVFVRAHRYTERCGVCSKAINFIINERFAL